MFLFISYIILVAIHLSNVQSICNATKLLDTTISSVTSNQFNHLQFSNTSTTEKTLSEGETVGLTEDSQKENLSFVSRTHRGQRLKRENNKKKKNKHSAHACKTIHTRNVHEGCLFDRLYKRNAANVRKGSPNNTLEDAEDWLHKYPPKDGKITVHALEATVIDFRYTEWDHLFVITTILKMEWPDDRLKWNSTLSKHLAHFNLMNPDDIWHPPFSGEVGVGGNTVRTYADITKVNIHKDGMVRATYRIVSYETDMCTIDYRHFPTAQLDCCHNILTAFKASGTTEATSTSYQRSTKLRIAIPEHRGFHVSSPHLNPHGDKESSDKYKIDICITFKNKNAMRRVEFIAPSILVTLFTLCSPCMQCLITQIGVITVALVMLIGWYGVMALESLHVHFNDQTPDVYVLYYFSFVVVLVCLIVTTVLRRVSTEALPGRHPPLLLVKLSNHVNALCGYKRAKPDTESMSFSVVDGEVKPEGSSEESTGHVRSAKPNEWSDLWFTVNILFMLLLAFVYFIGVIVIFS